MSYKTSLNNPEIILQANRKNFERIAMEVFHYQYNHNELYQAYCNALHTNMAAVKCLTDIPFLPISFFKTHIVVAAPQQTAVNPDTAIPPTLVFESSGTTGEATSRHYVSDAGIYEKALLQGFEQFYGAPQQYAILALLPSYLERKNASLVHMARIIMEKSGHPENGFYINEWAQLHEVLGRLERNGQKALLLGVTFALLDFAAAYPMQLSNTVVMETGGMKGRRAELTRSEVHDILKKQFGLKQVHSEYGMTELLSQAYSNGNGIFKCAETMRVFVRNSYDPLEVNETGSGGLNIIDLANVHSCAFIATEDIGKIAADGSFEVMGRIDHSAMRGCSLLAV